MENNIKQVAITIIIISFLSVLLLIIGNIYSEYSYNKILINEEKERVELENNYNNLINQKLELLNVEITWIWFRRNIKFGLKNNFDKKIDWIVFWYVLEDIFKKNVFIANSYSDSFSLFITNLQNPIESWDIYSFNVNADFYKWFNLVKDEKITLKWIEIQDIIFEDGERYNFKDKNLKITLKNNN